MKKFIFSLLLSVVVLLTPVYASSLISSPTDTSLVTSDVTVNNCSTSKHGFTPKAPNDTTKFLRGDCTWATTPGATFSGFYESAQQTITAQGSLTLAHGLGSIPVLVQVWLINTSAEGNYSIGDMLPVHTTGVLDRSGNFMFGASIVPDATNLNIRYADYPTVWVIPNKITGTALAITLSKWKAIFRAWK